MHLAHRTTCAAVGLALLLASGAAWGRPSIPGEHFNDWYETRDRDRDGIFTEFSLINYFFTRLSASNMLPDPAGLRGVSLGPIGTGLGSMTRVGPAPGVATPGTENFFAEQRWIPVLSVTPYFTSGWATFRAMMEVDFSWGIAANTVQPNQGGGFNADQVNIQTKNVYAALFPTKNERKLALLIGTQPAYDSIYNPHNVPVTDLVRTGYKLAFLGSDATGASLYNSYGVLGKLSFFPLGGAQPDKATKNDPRFSFIWLLTADLGYELWPGTVVSLSYWHLQDDSQGAAYALEGLLNSGPASSGLSGFTGTSKFNLDRPTGHVEYVGLNFHHNLAFNTSDFALSGFFMYNLGSFKNNKEGSTLLPQVKVGGFAANLEAIWKWGRTRDDVISLELMYTNGDSDPNDDHYTGPFTMNFYGLPGAVWFNHKTLLLFPFSSTISNYTGAVTDISNQGFGLIAGILAAQHDLIPHKLNLKVGAAFGASEAKPPPYPDATIGRGKIIGTELNAELRYHIRYLMTVGLHGAYLIKGNFYKESPTVTQNPWALFTTFTWYAF